MMSSIHSIIIVKCVEPCCVAEFNGHSLWYTPFTGEDTDTLLLICHQSPSQPSVPPIHLQECECGECVCGGCVCGVCVVCVWWVCGECGTLSSQATSRLS